MRRDEDDAQRPSCAFQRGSAVRAAATGREGQPGPDAIRIAGTVGPFGPIAPSRATRKISCMVNKHNPARRTRVLAALAALVTIGLCATPLLAGATPSTKTVSFSAKFSGKASLLIENSKVTISSITGSGTNSLFGTSKVSGSGSAAASAECDPFGGKGTISGGTNKITFTVTQSSAQQGCSTARAGRSRSPSTASQRQPAGPAKGMGRRHPQVQRHPASRRDQRISKRLFHCQPQREADGEGLMDKKPDNRTGASA